MSRLLIITFWIFSTSLLCAQRVDNNPDQGDVHQKFVSGGTVRMHLEAGNYTVEGTDSSDIAVTYRANNADQLKNVRVSIKTSGSNAELSVKGTPHNNFHATIEVPRVSNLWMRLSAGNVDIKSVEGDKDVQCRAGNVDIEVAHSEDYGHREASVLAGNIDASVFNISKGGLWRSFKQDGPGKYRFQVHLTAGNLTLTGPS
jgi:hypothetical protein